MCQEQQAAGKVQIMLTVKQLWFFWFSVCVNVKFHTLVNILLGTNNHTAVLSKNQTRGKCRKHSASRFNTTFLAHAALSLPLTQVWAYTALYVCLQSLFLRLSNTNTAVNLLPRNPLTAFPAQSPFTIYLDVLSIALSCRILALNLNCLFCPSPLSSSLLSGVREGDRLWALNYPCSTVALKQCGWTNFMSAMMVWRAVILFHWSPLVHLLHLHPSFLSSLAAPSLHPQMYVHTHTSTQTHTYCTYAQHSSD